MSEQTLVTLIGQFAFPIVMVVWFALRLENKLDAMSKSVDTLSKTINRLAVLVYSALNNGKDEAVRTEAEHRLREEIEKNGVAP
jgi:hypothetical protein